jgi:transcriptional regulator with XRE-family HTH domain
MTDESLTTDMLLNKLSKTESVSRFISRHKDHMSQIPFHIYINQLCDANGIVVERIIEKANISSSYGHQIFNGTRNPSRDKVIQIAFGFEMDYEHAQKLLKAARKNALYAKVERDAVIIYAMKKRLSVVEVQILLDELSMPILGKDDKYE